MLEALKQNEIHSEGTIQKIKDDLGTRCATSHTPAAFKSNIEKTSIESAHSREQVLEFLMFAEQMASFSAMSIVRSTGDAQTMQSILEKFMKWQDDFKISKTNERTSLDLVMIAYAVAALIFVYD